MRELIRAVVPFSVRLGLLRLRRMPSWILETRSVAQSKTDERSVFAYLLFSHSSPIDREPVAGVEGKMQNLRLAAAALDGLVVGPYQVFSHHHVIGLPTRRRGFADGIELRNGIPTMHVGGGLCQVSNSFHWVALNAGMRIVERHRHGLDLFPDQDRTVPFGSGATVVYNYADFRFENPLSTPVMLSARIEGRAFVAELWTTRDPGLRVDVYEKDHRFFESDGKHFRENHLWRRITTDTGDVLVDQEVVHTLAAVRYER
jgi:vancomycin resistance protein VanW